MDRVDEWDARSPGSNPADGDGLPTVPGSADGAGGQGSIPWVAGFVSSAR